MYKCQKILDMILSDQTDLLNLAESLIESSYHNKCADELKEFNEIFISKVIKNDSSIYLSSHFKEFENLIYTLNRKHGYK